MVKEGWSSSAVLAAFAEPLVEGRRVLVFGSALSPLPRLLLERGARLVHVCDPQPLRVAEAGRRPHPPGLTLSTLVEDEIAAREGAMDCVLVEHLGAFDARSTVARAKRLLAVRGVALFLTPNREARRPLLPPPEQGVAPLDYYALYDLVSAEFENVRMLGQAPFIGYAVVDFTPDAELEPTIDSEFVPRGSEEPELFVAVASRHRPSLTGHALVQLPLASLAPSAALADRAAPSPVRAVRESELERQLKRQEAWIRELEARAATADERADLAESELESLREELEAERSQRADERGQEGGAREENQARLAELEAELSLRATALSEGRTALAELRAQLEASEARSRELESGAAAELALDLETLEARLSERGQEVRRLEQQLAEAERIGKELLSELAQAEKPPSATARDQGPSVGDAVRLAELLAVAEADRLALSWVAALGSGVEPPGGR